MRAAEYDDTSEGTTKLSASFWPTARLDGTVLHSSALLDERTGGAWEPKLVSTIRWKGVTFLFSGHVGMTRDPAFADNVLYLLLEDRRN